MIVHFGFGSFDFGRNRHVKESFFKPVMGLHEYGIHGIQDQLEISAQPRPEADAAQEDSIPSLY